jgi:hypothetical protein
MQTVLDHEQLALFTDESQTPEWPTLSSRQKLYAYITDFQAVPRSETSAREYYGWTVAFTTNREAAMELRKYFPVPLSLIKKLRRRCPPGDECCGEQYSSWRFHPLGSYFQPEWMPRRMLALTKLLATNIREVCNDEH